MGFEIKDRRAEKAAAESAAALAPAEVHERLEAAVARGDVEEINRVASDCGGGPKHEVVPFKKTVRGEKQEWKSIGYVVAFLPVGQAQVLMVRAVGMRTDEKVFTADYAMPPVWVDGMDFSVEARKRLDTFKACSCDRDGRCKFHGDMLPGSGRPGEWLKSDMERLQKIQGSPLPEAVEVLMKAEAARQNNRIVVPGRP